MEARLLPAQLVWQVTALLLLWRGPSSGVVTPSPFFLTVVPAAAAEAVAPAPAPKQPAAKQAPKVEEVQPFGRAR